MATLTRDYQGYKQVREEYEIQTKPRASSNACEEAQASGGFKTVKRWVFIVTGFCFDDEHCHVLKSDGSEEEVKIDDKDRILINGKKYTRKHWNH